MSDLPYGSPEDLARRATRRAAESGSAGYTAASDDELNQLEIDEGLMNPSSKRGGAKAGAGGMMPPMMMGAGRGGMGGADPRVGGGSGVGSAGGVGSVGGVLPPGTYGGAGTGASGIGAGGAPGIGAGGGPGLGSLGGGSIGGTLPSSHFGTSAADGSSSSPSRINPSTGLPWSPADPNYPGGSNPYNPGASAPTVPNYPGGSNPYNPAQPGDSDPGIPKQPGTTPIDPGFGDIDIPRGEYPAKPPKAERPIAAPGEDPADPPKAERPITPPDTGGQNPPGGPGAPGDPGDQTQIDTEDLRNAAREWEQLSERMSSLSKQMDQLKVSEASFGLAEHPRPSYTDAVHTTGVRQVQSAEEYSTTADKLVSSAKDYQTTEDTNTQASNSLMAN